MGKCFSYKSSSNLKNNSTKTFTIEKNDVYYKKSENEKDQIKDDITTAILSQTNTFLKNSNSKNPYKLGPLIRKGAYGNSYLCFDSEKSEKYFVKILILINENHLNSGIEYFKEQFLKIKHDNFVNYIKIFHKNKEIWVISEYFESR